jgi:hypothetical protein
MRCGKAGKHLGSYLDGELQDPLRTSLEKHLRVCPKCARRAEDLRRMADVLSSFSEVRPGETERARIRARIKEAMRERKEIPLPAPTVRWKLQVAAAASLILLAVAAVGLAVSLLPGGTVIPEETTGPEKEAGGTLYLEGTEATAAETTDEEEAPERTTGGETAFLSSPSLALTDREYSREELRTYQEDLAARMEFYNAFWKPYLEGDPETPDPGEVQETLLAGLQEEAVRAGMDPSPIMEAVNAALADSTRKDLLPCYVEVARLEGRDVCLVSLSGPGDGALFPQPGSLLYTLASREDGEAAIAHTESLLKELAREMCPSCGGAIPAPQASAAGEASMEEDGIVPAEGAAPAPGAGAGAAAPNRVDLKSLARELVAGNNAPALAEFLREGGYEALLLLLQGKWKALGEGDPSLSDLLNIPKNLLAVDLHTGEIIWRAP